jgi:chromosome partitioning protein
MRTIAVVNQKGGCGKTTTAINLAGFLAAKRRRTLVVDMDPQGHATLGLLRDAQPSPTMYDVFVHHRHDRETRLGDITRRIGEHLDLAPADILLSMVPETLSGQNGRERILAEVLDEVRAHYDYVLVDCPPHVGLLTFNALYACSEAIVPVDPSFFSLHGIGKLLETIDVLVNETGHEISARALVTLYCGRSQFARDVVDNIRRNLSGRYFSTVIRHSVKLAEAASHGVPIVAYCTRCAGFDDYAALAGEILQTEDSSTTEAVRPGASAPTVTPEGVVFAVEAPAARHVHLVGDFNGWALEGSEMQPLGRIWTSTVKLRPGSYRYRFVVDGEWQSDPLNAVAEPTPFGGHNSVLVLDSSAAE